MNSSELERIGFYFCVLIIMLFLLMILFISYRVMRAEDLPKRTEDLDPTTLETGDILGVGYRHPFGWFVTAWSSSVWSHCGIVWKDPVTSEPFVLEAAMYGGKYNGMFKIPLAVWTSINRGSYLGLTRIRGKPVDAKKLMNAFNARKRYVGLEAYNWKWYRLLTVKPFTEENRTKYTCYEIVVSVLQDAGVLNKNSSCSSFFPTDIMEGKLEFVKGYTSEPPVTLCPEEYYALKSIEEEKHKSGKSKKSKCSSSG
jgi:hypothetical protein